MSLTKLLFITVYHRLRYNTSLANPCGKTTCSHLCLLVPGGRRCACPDGATQAPLPRRSTQDIICDAGIYYFFA